MVSRRNFLKILAAVTTAATAPKVAGALLKSNKTDKYITALAMMEIVIAEGVKVQNFDDVKTRDTTLLHKKWDALYEFIFANFKDPRTRQNSSVGFHEMRDTVPTSDQAKAEVTSTKELFKLTQEELKYKLYKIPPVMLEECFPVWLTRYMFREQCLPLDPTRLETFNKFCSMYGYMIAHAGE